MRNGCANARNSSRIGELKARYHRVGVFKTFQHLLPPCYDGGKVMSGSELNEGRPGVGRLNYFLGKVGIGVAMVVAINYLDPQSSWVRVIGMTLTYVSFALDVMRLRCIGLSRWYA